MPRILPVTSHSKLLEFLLASESGQPRTVIKNLLKHGAVSVNGAAVTRHDHALAPGDTVGIGKTTGRHAPPLPFPVVYEDAAIIVIDKPAGLLTMGTEHDKQGTVHYLLNVHLKPRGERVFIVHRLDRETSGLVVFAKTEAAKHTLQGNWERAEKTYLAIVHRVPAQPEGTVDTLLMEDKTLHVHSVEKARGAKRGVTHWRVLEAGRDRALLEVRIDTGRKHQIRVHLADIGHPIIGDDRYGHRNDGSRRMLLHASRLELDHPETGKWMTFEAGGWREEIAGGRL